MKNASIGTITRTIVLMLALLNQVLIVIGKNPLPWSDEQAYEAISQALTIVAATAAWWKNNSFTQEAIEADEILKELKKKEC